MAKVLKQNMGILLWTAEQLFNNKILPLCFSPFCLWRRVHFHLGTKKQKKKKVSQNDKIVVRMSLCLCYFYLFHEGLAQTRNLGNKNRIVGEVGAQVAKHAEYVPA